jgi:predicted AAA+ superfamily ATPase
VKDTVLLRDIIQRRNIKDAVLLDDIFAYLINNISNLFSANNIANYLKSSRKTSYDTVSNYISFIEDTFLIHKTERFDIRGKEILSGTCKYYANDMSYKNYLYKGFAGGIGYLLENMVYLQLRQLGFNVYTGVLRNKEIDFVAMKEDRKIYVQSSYLLLDEQTIAREYEPLLSIADHYEKYVVSLDEVTLASNNGVKHVQAWDLKNVIMK